MIRLESRNKGRIVGSTSRSILVLATLLVIVLCACERKEYPQAAAHGAPLGAPEYHSRPSLSSTASVAYVSEVMPGGPGGAIDGQALYVANCSACHQATGKGVPGAFPPLDGSPYVTGDNVERLAAIMIYGLMGEIKVLGATYNNVMLPLGHLKNEELAAIASYIRTSWSNKASAVEPAVFAKVRSKHGQRSQFNIKELGEEP